MTPAQLSALSIEELTTLRTKTLQKAAQRYKLFRHINDIQASFSEKYLLAKAKFETIDRILYEKKAAQKTLQKPTKKSRKTKDPITKLLKQIKTLSPSEQQCILNKLTQANKEA